MQRRHFLCPLEDLEAGHTRTLELHAETPRRRQAIVFIDEGGELRAYVNECMHIAIPLDLYSGDLWSEDKKHLRCLTHGALYRPKDGYCVHGPCVGQSLERLRVEVQSDGVYVIDENANCSTVCGA